MRAAARGGYPFVSRKMLVRSVAHLTARHRQSTNNATSILTVRATPIVAYKGRVRYRRSRDRDVNSAMDRQQPTQRAKEAQHSARQSEFDSVCELIDGTARPSDFARTGAIMIASWLSSVLKMALNA